MTSIKDLLEAGDKRTQGKWIAIPWETVHGHEKHHGWFVECHVNNDPCEGETILGYDRTVEYIDEGNAIYIANAPEMEAKLREIAEMLPEINRLLELYYCGSHHDRTVLLTKLEKWENE